MKAAIEAIRNKEMGSYKASGIFNLQKKYYSVMLKTDNKAHVKQ